MKRQSNNLLHGQEEEGASGEVSHTSRTPGAFLDAAEREFAEHGYNGATIRAISHHAGVNLGTLHYHFGSKRCLFVAVCERRLRSIGEERRRRLNICETFTGLDAEVQVRALLQAMLEPILLVPRESDEHYRIVRKLHARVLSEEGEAIQDVLRQIYHPASGRFVQMLREACTHLDEAEFQIRTACVFGTFIHIYTDVIRPLREGEPDVIEAQGDVDQYVHFLTRGLMAPPEAVAWRSGGA